MALKLSPGGGTSTPTRPATAGDNWATGRARVETSDSSSGSPRRAATLSTTWDHGQNEGAPDAAGDRPTCTGTFRRRAISSSVSSSVVLPMPGSPANSTSDPLPLVVSLSSAACSTPSSRSRPTSIRVEPPAAGAGSAVSVDAAAELGVVATGGAMASSAAAGGSRSGSCDRIRWSSESMRLEGRMPSSSSSMTRNLRWTSSASGVRPHRYSASMSSACGSSRKGWSAAKPSSAGRASACRPAASIASNLPSIAAR